MEIIHICVLDRLPASCTTARLRGASVPQWDAENVVSAVRIRKSKVVESSRIMYRAGVGRHEVYRTIVVRDGPVPLFSNKI